MNVILLCNEYPPRPHAGIGSVVQTIARGLARRGHGVTVVGFGEANEESMDEGVRVVTLRGNRLRYIGNLISRLHLRKWLNATVKAGRIDVVEAPDSEGLLPFRNHGYATIIRLHSSFTTVNQVAGVKTSPGISFYERRTVAINPNWIAVSNYVLDLTQATFRVSPKRSTIIYNPVSPPPPNLPEVEGLAANYVLFAGHVRPRKGADVLAEAVRGIMSQRPDLHLVYVGGMFSKDGRPMSEHIRIILGSGLAKRVHFLGHLEREKVLTCMTYAKVFVLPSYVESFAMVVVEAMSCGVPVVFTRNPPGPEIIEDGVTGLLADPASPRDVGEKISRILDDPVLAKRLAENARKIVAERFSVERAIEATERFYEECVKD